MANPKKVITYTVARENMDTVAFPPQTRTRNAPKKSIKRDFTLDFPSNALQSLLILCFPDFGVMSEASEVVGKSNLG